MKPTIRDRIKEFRRVPARELLDHNGNHRRHSQAQRDALRGVLEHVAIAGALAAASEGLPSPTRKGSGEPSPRSRMGTGMECPARRCKLPAHAAAG